MRSCCLSEIKQTEERYTETLESIEKVLNQFYVKCLDLIHHNWDYLFLYHIHTTSFHLLFVRSRNSYNHKVRLVNLNLIA